MKDLERGNKELYMQLDKVNYKYNETTKGIQEIISSLCKNCKDKDNCRKQDCHIYNIEQLLIK